MAVAVEVAVALLRKSLMEVVASLEGEDGADLEIGWNVTSDFGTGISRDILRFCRRENLGMGNELGGGEFE